MSWGQIGAVLIALVIVFIVGHLWFHIVEGVLGGLKRLFSRKKEPPRMAPPPARRGQCRQGGNEACLISTSS